MDRYEIDWNETEPDFVQKKRPVQKKKPDSVHEKQDEPARTKRSVDEARYHDEGGLDGGLNYKTMGNITGIVALGMVLLCWIFK